MTFGIINLVSFKTFIMPNLTLRLFYFFALTCLVLTIVSCWLDIQLWFKFTWLLFNGLVRTFEISFAWCQTLAFLQLCFKLSQA